MTSLADLSATELIRLFRSRSAVPEEAVKACVDRIAEREPTLNAVVTLTAEEGMKQARTSARRYKDGTARRLEGVPFGLKDIIETKGVRTTGGSSIYGDFIPSANATVAARILGAGGVLLAKLQTYEFAGGLEPNAHYGRVPNPWDTSRVTGGSSSGSGSAIAARYFPLAVGSDTGGSIRIPASFCGITGLKPTFGLVPRTRVMPLSWTFDHVGPMTRTVEDNALMLSVMAGKDRSDPSSIYAPRVDYTDGIHEGVAGMTIAVPTNWFFTRCDREIADATHGAIRHLSEAGAKIIDVTLPHVDLAEPIFWTIMSAESASLHEASVDRLSEYDPTFASHLITSQFISAGDYLRALRMRRLVQADFEAVFASADAIITPGTPSVAPLSATLLAEIDSEGIPWVEVTPRCTVPFSVVGVPALTLPSGLSRNHLPMSTCVATQPFNERVAYRIGRAVEEWTGFNRLAPPTAPVEARD